MNNFHQTSSNPTKAYFKLNELKRLCPQTPIIALTATATSKVQGDIARCLHLQNPLVTVTSFDRQNLFIDVVEKVNLCSYRSICSWRENVSDGTQMWAVPPTIGSSRIYFLSKRIWFKVYLPSDPIGFKFCNLRPARWIETFWRWMRSKEKSNPPLFIAKRAKSPRTSRGS